jgi:hypothetical protein
MLNISRSTTANARTWQQIDEERTFESFLNAYAEPLSHVNEMYRTLKQADKDGGVVHRWENEWRPHFNSLVNRDRSAPNDGARVRWVDENMDKVIWEHLKRPYEEFKVEQLFELDKVRAFFQEHVLQWRQIDEAQADMVGKVMAHLRKKKLMASTHEALYKDKDPTVLEEHIMDAYGT